VAKSLPPHPEAAQRAAPDLSPQAGRGNWTRCHCFYEGPQTAVIICADFRNEVLGASGYAGTVIASALTSPPLPQPASDTSPDRRPKPE
jgi:hypothetical protein